MRLTWPWAGPSREYIEHLKDENAWLRQQMIHERQRAEVAIDKLLNMKLPGLGPVTVPTPAEMREVNEFSGPGDKEFERIGDLTE